MTDYTDTNAVDLLAALNHYAECFPSDRPGSVVDLVEDLVTSISRDDVTAASARIIDRALRLWSDESLSDDEHERASGDELEPLSELEAFDAFHAFADACIRRSR